MGWITQGFRNRGTDDRFFSVCWCRWEVHSRSLAGVVRSTAFHQLVAHDRRDVAYLLDEIPRSEVTIFDDLVRLTEGRDG